MTRPQSEADKAAEMSRQLAEFQELARTSFARRVAILEAAAQALAEGTLVEDERRTAERAAHGIAGAAAMFGYHEATPLARALEESLGTGLSPAAAAVMARRVTALRRILDEATIEQSAPRPADRPALAVHTGPEFESAIRDAARDRGLDVTTDPLTEAVTAAIVDIATADGLSMVHSYTDRVPPIPVVALGDTESLSDRLTACGAGASLVVSRAQPPSALIDTAESLVERRRRTRFRILAVDDDETILAAVSALLAGNEYDVTTLMDPRGFMAALELATPDLVVLDLDMPHVDGAELCRVLRTDPRWSTVPVLFLTAVTDSTDIGNVFASGADDFISKPVNETELRVRVRNRIERVQLLRELAETDPLTGLANRSRLEDEFDRLRRLAERFDQPLSLALLDLDRFKRVNDDHGHSAGDLVLRRLASHLTAAFRGEDVIARWGGEEFAILALGMSRAVAVHRVRALLDAFSSTDIDVHDDATLRVSFSAGVAQVGEDGSDLSSLMRSADAALYRAKRAGRAQVVPAGNGEPTAAGRPGTPERTVGDPQTYYRNLTDTQRLDATGHGRLELLRTKELLAEHLPQPPARILDVGGTGVYARWLADLNYRVLLVDPVPERVSAALSEPGNNLTAVVGDARHLEQPDNSADAVLLLGPLSQLLEHDERITALQQARRVLRPGGLVAAAVVSRHAALIAAASRGTLDAWQRDLALSALVNGRHDPRPSFTTAYFHTPDEAVTECRDAGFADATIHAIEGPMWATLKTNTNPSMLSDLLDSALVCARAIEQDPALLAASAHLLVTGHA